MYILTKYYYRYLYEGENRMFTLKRIGQLVLLTCLSIWFLNSSASAATMTLMASDDLSIKVGASAPQNPLSDYNFTTVVGGANKTVTYLKFDLTPLAGNIITSAKLQLYGSIDTDASEVLTNNIGVYYADPAINWNETSTFSWATKPEYAGNYITSYSTSNSLISLYEWNLPITDAGSDVARGYVTFVLQDNTTDDVDVKTIFISKNNPSVTDGYKGPKLVVEYTPAPEPSSLLLGMLSLSGLLGLKRKK